MPRLSPAARAHRADLAELVRLAENDLRVMFRHFDTVDAVRDGLMDVLPRLSAVYGSAAATLAANWYDDLRTAQDVKGRFTATPVELPDRGRTDALARWSVTPLFDAPVREIAAAALGAVVFSKVTGGLQRIIANAARHTVTSSAVRDPRAGWVRVGHGECDWCKNYLDGEVHYTEGYDFKAHDHCQCNAEPRFD